MNIDALARHGHRFDRAFVANPVCMPNRATIMSGQWPSVHGLRTNGLPLNPECDTFVRVLRRNGWRTSAAGKLHLQLLGCIQASDRERAHRWPGKRLTGIYEGRVWYS